MLKDDINAALSTSMKNRDEKLTSALRNIKSKVLELEKKEVGKQVSNEEVIAILRKLAKERKQSIDMYQQGNRADLVEAEAYELSVIESYLPQQLSKEDIEAKVTEVISENNFATIKDMGKAIKAFNEKYPGLADGKTLSDVIKAKLA